MRFQSFVLICAFLLTSACSTLFVTKPLPLETVGAHCLSDHSLCTLEIPLENDPVTERMFKPENLETLNSVASHLRYYPKQKAQIEGHTISSGDHNRDLQQGENIASFIRQYLIHNKVKENQISILSFGSTKPSAQSMENKPSLRAVILIR